MRRREFLTRSGLGLLAGLRSAESAYPDGMAAPATAEHLPATGVQAGAVPVPAGERGPFDWPTFGVSPAGRGGDAVVTWSPGTERRLAGLGVRLRVRTALDVREEKRIVVALAGSGRDLGTLDLRNPCPFQPFELVLSPADAAAAAREGIRLRQETGARPAWFFGPDTVAADPTLPPHLLVDGPTDPVAEFHRRLLSMGSVQEFGWMEGCVLDGLWHARRGLGEAAALEVIDRHFALFLDDQKRLRYEGPRNRPQDGRVQGVETGLPFATLARIQPDHPALDAARSFWLRKLRPDGTYHPGDTELYSAEGAYTVAYPLAVLGRVREEPALLERAVKVLEVRRDELPRGDDLYLRAHGDVRTYRNWARGYAWYLLGFARTMQVLGEHPSAVALREAFVRVAAMALRRQQPDGLWACYLGEPLTGTECGGSAGIAAAMAVGAREGWLSAEFHEAAGRAWQGLLTHLAPDGFLGGVSQSNCCGEAFQRSGYRVFYPMAMGLMVQLEAALDR